MLSPYHPAMLDAAANAPKFDLPDPDRMYANYLQNCRRNGVQPVSGGLTWLPYAATMLTLLRA